MKMDFYRNTGVHNYPVYCFVPDLFPLYVSFLSDQTGTGWRAQAAYSVTGRSEDISAGGAEGGLSFLEPSPTQCTNHCII